MIREAASIIEEVLEKRWSCDERAIAVAPLTESAISIGGLTMDTNAATLVADAIGRLLDKQSTVLSDQQQALRSASHQILALEQRIAFQKWDTPSKLGGGVTAIPLPGSSSARSSGAKRFAKENVTPTSANPLSFISGSSDISSRRASKITLPVRRNLLAAAAAGDATGSSPLV